jgi:hypothetical protein
MTDCREPPPFAEEGGCVSRAPRAARRRPSAGAAAATKPEGAGGGIAVRWLPVEALTPDKRNARIHSARQVARIADSIAAFGFNVPILVDDKGGVLAGHGRLLAAKRLGLREAPTITLGHLNEARRRAFVIADNRLGELASWDQAQLGAELKELKSLDLDFGIELTGFEMSEIDLRIEGCPSAPRDAARHPTAPGSQSGNRPPPSPARGEGRGRLQGRAVARAGDTWDLGPHRLHCGDAAGAEDGGRASRAPWAARRRPSAGAAARDDEARRRIGAGAFLALDAAIRQWQSLTKESARLHPTGETFDSVERSRRSESPVQ